MSVIEILRQLTSSLSFAAHSRGRNRRINRATAEYDKPRMAGTVNMKNSSQWCRCRLTAQSYPEKVDANPVLLLDA